MAALLDNPPVQPGPPADPADRPVYGYVTKDATGLAAGTLLSGYGAVRVGLRNETIGTRTTWMFGDSAEQHAYENAYPVPLTAPSHWALPFEGGQGISRNTRQSDMVLSHDGPRGGPYVEAQVHGGVHVSDIAHVTFTVPPPDDLRAALERHRIPWHQVAAPD